MHGIIALDHFACAPPTEVGSPVTGGAALLPPRLPSDRRTRTAPASTPLAHRPIALIDGARTCGATRAPTGAGAPPCPPTAMGWTAARNKHPLPWPPRRSRRRRMQLGRSFWRVARKESSGHAPVLPKRACRTSDASTLLRAQPLPARCRSELVWSRPHPPPPPPNPLSNPPNLTGFAQHRTRAREPHTSAPPLCGTPPRT